MRLNFTFLVFLFAAQVALTQTTRVQFIHNAMGGNVDLYVNDALVSNDLVFRTATPYLDVAAGDVKIKIAPGNSGSANDATATFEVNLHRRATHTIMIGLNEKQQSAYELFIDDFASEYADTEETVGLSFIHGAPDAGDVDFLTFGFPLFDDIAYGSIGEFISVPAIEFETAITPATDNEELLVKNVFDFHFWKGKSVVLFTSGYLDREPKMKTYAALSNGGTFPLEHLPVAPDGSKAFVQFIHNAPTESVDIYLDDQLVVNDLVFRTATAYLDLPAKGEVTLGIAPKDSRSFRDVIVKTPISLIGGSHYVMTVNGISERNNYMDLDLDIYNTATQEADSKENVSLLFCNGAMGAPMVDLLIDGVPYHNDVKFGDYASYVTLPASAFHFDIAAATDNESISGSFVGDFTFWKGRSAVLFASGYFDGQRPGFTLYVALPTGGTFPLRAIGSGYNAGIQGRTDAEIEGFEWKEQADEFVTVMNPADDFIRTQAFLYEPTAIRATVFDAKGYPVKHKDFGLHYSGTHMLDIDIYDLSSGMYFIRWEARGIVHMQRVIVTQH